MENLSEQGNELLPLVQKGNDLYVSSRIVADLLNIKHRNLVGTIEKYKTTIETDFGQLPFETEGVRNGVGAINEAKTYFLNEGQATFIGSLSKNSQKVIAFKTKLVKTFLKAKEKSIMPISREEQFASAVLLAQEVIREMEIKNEAQSQLLQLQAPKIQNYGVLLNSDQQYTMEEAAKIIGTGRNRLFKLLVEDGFFDKVSRLPKTRLITENYFRMHVAYVEALGITKPQPFATAKGLDLICSWYKTRNHVAKPKTL